MLGPLPSKLVPDLTNQGILLRASGAFRPGLRRGSPSLVSGRPTTLPSGDQREGDPAGFKPPRVHQKRDRPFVFLPDLENGWQKRALAWWCRQPGPLTWSTGCGDKCVSRSVRGFYPPKSYIPLGVTNANFFFGLRNPILHCANFYKHFRKNLGGVIFSRSRGQFS